MLFVLLNKWKYHNDSQCKSQQEQSQVDRSHKSPEMSREVLSHTGLTCCTRNVI